MSIVAASAVLAIRDATLSVAERYVLLVYATHARQPDDPDAPLEAWPSAVLVAAETGLSREHVQRCLAVLQDRGLLRQTGRRRGRANVYAVSLRRIRHLCGHITPTCDATSQGPVMPHHTEREVEPEVEPEGLSVTADEAFEQFWQTYPRRVAKGSARKAWTKALKITDAETILAGAKTYAAQRQGQDPTYTAHPSTWLNAERWGDDPAAVGKPRLSQVKDTNADHWAAGGDFMGNRPSITATTG